MKKQPLKTEPLGEKRKRLLAAMKTIQRTESEGINLPRTIQRKQRLSVEERDRRSQARAAHWSKTKGKSKGQS